ncbi:MAG: DegQ family serine endoprotease [Candidatus Zixiibacteriota bacterium]
MHKKGIYLTGITLAIGIIIGVLFTANFDLMNKIQAQEQPVEETKQTGKLIPEHATLADVVEKASPYVVSITSTRVIRYRKRSASPYDHPMFREFFGLPPDPSPGYGEFEEKGLGSGVIVSDDGYILTNAHVVDQADEVIVRIEDKKYNAEIIGVDTRSDVAVLKIETNEEKLPCAKIGDSEKIRVGDWVIAIGNPFELEHTVTAGIISAKGRSNVGIVDYEDFLQTDASINPGNSGGALVDLDGKLVGINTAIASRSGGFQGIGFAIPVNMAVKVMEQLIESGFVDRGFLGITLQPINEDLAEALSLESTKGALISSVLPGSPAEEAGIESGDVIIAVDDIEVETVPEIRNDVALTAPGTKIELTVIRNGRARKFDLILASMSEYDGDYGYRNNRGDSDKRPTGIDLGITVAPLTRAILKENDLSSSQTGVFITDVDPESSFYEVGVREGDIILEINKKIIEDIDDYDDVVSELRKGDKALFLLQRQSKVFYIAVRITE